MWKENSVFQEDMEGVCAADFIPWEQLRGKTVLVTGATGLIGSTAVKCLLYAGQQRELGLQVLALVRDPEKGSGVFAAELAEGAPLAFAVGSVEALPQIPGPVDYILHGASPTASAWFVSNPVETIQTAVNGTAALLELAREKHVSGFVFLSSMEVYGYQSKGTKIGEDTPGALNTTTVRNSYPLSKQLCECLCASYASEYGVPVRIARLTQTFGPGVRYNDGRVFAEFARCMVEKRNIVLKTRGETERCYIYTADAVAALLTLLLKGETGQAYNLANEDTYCSVLEMARLCAEAGGVQVDFDLRDAAALGYLNVLYSNLNTDKLRALGWQPSRNLAQMYSRMIQTMKRAATDI